MTAWLVTGGAGFIGSHLCEALLARGDTVRVLDDLSTGRQQNLPPGVELIEGDVADLPVVCRAVEGIAGCFHLAAIASVERGVTDWLGAHRTNLTGTITLFDAIRRLPTRIPVVYASSAAVYGDAAALPIVEASRVSSALGVWRGQIWLRTARTGREPRARNSHGRAAFFQCLRPAPGSALAVFRRDFELL